MTEVARNPLETMQPHEAIAAVMHGWLAEEIRSSTTNQNAYLDNWDSFLKDGAAKVAGHYDRLELWTQEFRKNPDDSATSHQIYGVATGLSGAFRTQCYLLASNQDDYYAKRLGPNPLGLDISLQVNDRLFWHFGKMPKAEDLKKQRILTQTIISNTHATNNLRLDYMDRLHKDENPKVGMKKLHHNIRLTRLQEAWMNLGVDYIVYAAQQRDGDLASVPMLEPRRITEAEIFYPFANY